MKNNIKFFLLGLSVIFAASLSACGTNTQNPTDVHTELSSQLIDIASDSEVFIPYENCTLSFSWWGNAEDNENMLSAIDTFEAKYPGITINPSYGIWNGWEESVTHQFETEYTPDINQITLSWIHDYSADGSLFLDLNMVADILDLSQIEQKYLDTCIIAEELQAVPISTAGKLFCWNKATFDKAGISIPSTLEELITAGEIFQKKLGDDYYPLVLDENDKMFLMVQYLQSLYGKPWIENNALQYTVEELEKGLAFINSLEEAHVIPSSKELFDSNAASLLENKKWINGKYAGIFCWDYESMNYESSLKKGNEFIIGNTLTGMGEHTGTFTKITMAYAISESCQYPVEAALFIDFLLNQEESAALIGIKKGIPLSQSALAECSKQHLMNEPLLNAHTAILEDAMFNLHYYFEDNLLNGANGIYYDVMAGMSYEMYTPQMAAQTLYDGIKSVLIEKTN